MIDTAVIFAAGRGRRLDPLTRTIPKVLAPFFGIPVLDHTLHALRDAGVRRVILNGSYRVEALAAWVDRQREATDLEIELVPEPELLGTGGALGNMKSRIGGRAFVLNGDNLLRVDLAELASGHDRHDGEITLGYRPHCGGNGGHVLTTDRSGRLVSLRREKSYTPPGHEMDEVEGEGDGDGDGTRAVGINAGVMVADPEFFARFDTEPHGLEDDALPRYLASGLVACTLPLTGEVIDVGTPRSYLQAHLDVLRDPERVVEIRNVVETMAGTRNRLFVDQGANLAWLASALHLSPPEIEARGAFLAGGVRCGESVSVANSVVLEGATLGRGAVIADCLIGPGAVVAEGAHLNGICLSGRMEDVRSLDRVAEPEPSLPRTYDELPGLD